MKPKDSVEEVYPVIAALVALPVGIATWIYAVVTWGFLLGLGFGWIPGIIAGVIAGLLWPLIALVLLGAGGLLLWVVVEDKPRLLRILGAFLGIGVLAFGCVSLWAHQSRIRTELSDIRPALKDLIRDPFWWLLFVFSIGFLFALLVISRIR